MAGEKRLTGQINALHHRASLRQPSRRSHPASLACPWAANIKTEWMACVQPLFEVSATSWNSLRSFWVWHHEKHGLCQAPISFHVSALTPLKQSPACWRYVFIFTSVIKIFTLNRPLAIRGIVNSQSGPWVTQIWMISPSTALIPPSFSRPLCLSRYTVPHRASDIHYVLRETNFFFKFMFTGSYWGNSDEYRSI